MPPPDHPRAGVDRLRVPGVLEEAVVVAGRVDQGVRDGVDDLPGELGADSYLLIQDYTLAEAVYTTPSYWMAEDRDYRDAHNDHRGRFAEKFSEKRLSAVFGRDSELDDR